MTSGPDDVLRAALGLHRQQRIAEAEALYRTLLARIPAHPDALRLLGLCRYQQGSLEEARSLIAQSLEHDGGNPDAHSSLAVVLLDLGRPQEALASLDRALALSPRHGEAHLNRGRALEALGRPEEALDSLDRAVQCGVGGPALWYNRGLSLQRLGRHAQAVAAYDRAMAIDARNPRILVNRGEALRTSGRLEAAAESFRAALAVDPRSAMAHNGLGAVAHEQGLLDEALASYERALALAPGNPHALANRGRVLGQMGRREEAVGALEEAAALDAGNAQILADLGSALLALKRYDQARRHLDAALALSPAIPLALGDRLHADQQVCAWERYAHDTAAIPAEIEAGRLPAVPFTLLFVPGSARLQRRCAEAFVRRHYPAQSSPLWRGERYGHERIRVGYFSADFHDHPTAHLLAEVLERHDRSRFEISAYSFGRDAHDAWRARIQAAAERFHDVRQASALRIATLARGHELDVAVDLKGFTLGNRTGVFAHRPAPVQVNYLGYPGTMGAPYIDYLIADATLVRPGDEDGYTESVVCLPHSYQPNDRSRPIAAAPVSRAGAGLPEGAFVFCCFNHFAKINPPVFDAWMRILRQLPGAVLWLLDKNRAGTANLRREAEARGVAAARLVFSPDRDLPAHLARHRLADLFLDTVPCNAHTTASDALWAGLPVLTCLGETFAGRVAASLLNAAGLPELIARSLPEYEAAAISMARDPARLRSLRDRLAQGRLSVRLFDSARYARHLECAYERMWERQQRGLPPAPIRITDGELPLHCEGVPSPPRSPP